MGVEHEISFAGEIRARKMGAEPLQATESHRHPTSKTMIRGSKRIGPLCRGNREGSVRWATDYAMNQLPEG